jgi:hypothetical protein
MKKYIINYFFDGCGLIEVEANSKEEAREQFFSGECDMNNEYRDNYNIDEIEEKK